MALVVKKVKSESEVAQLCLTLCDTMDYIACQAPLSMGVLQARILKWVAMPSSRESSQSESESEVAQSCQTLCDPMDGSLPGSVIHGILQARILEWAAISFSRGSSQPRDRTQSPALQTDSLPSEPLGIFPNQGLNPGLLHCRQILYHLRHQGSPSVRLNCQNLIIFSYKSYALLFLPNIYISFCLFI